MRPSRYLIEQMLLRGDSYLIQDILYAPGLISDAAMRAYNRRTRKQDRNHGKDPCRLTKLKRTFSYINRIPNERALFFNKWHPKWRTHKIKVLRDAVYLITDVNTFLLGTDEGRIWTASEHIA